MTRTKPMHLLWRSLVHCRGKSVCVCGFFWGGSCKTMFSTRFCHIIRRQLELEPRSRQCEVVHEIYGYKCMLKDIWPPFLCLSVLKVAPPPPPTFRSTPTPQHCKTKTCLTLALWIIRISIFWCPIFFFWMVLNIRWLILITGSYQTCLLLNGHVYEGIHFAFFSTISQKLELFWVCGILFCFSFYHEY